MNVAEAERALGAALEHLKLAAIDFGGGGSYQRVGRAEQAASRAALRYAALRELAAAGPLAEVLHGIDLMSDATEEEADEVCDRMKVQAQEAWLDWQKGREALEKAAAGEEG